MKHKIGILGFGNVGQGIAEILLHKKEELKNRYGFDYAVTAIADTSHGNVYNPDGIDLERVLNDAKRGEPFRDHRTEWDNLKMIKETETTVWCELTHTDLQSGGPAVDHVRTCLKAGKHVVTSNKGPAALFYPEMKSLAAQHNVKFMIEGTVVAGTPVLNLMEGPLAGCSISKIRGILNGTTNYILTEMEQGMSFDEVLKEAQRKGYAEADPTGDVEGYDARGKVSILANVVMDAELRIDDIPCKGITHITEKDIAKAKRQNSRWKLFGSVERTHDGIKASVQPELISLDHPLAGVTGATNALTFTTDLLGDVTIVGPGAGRTETGFAILTDLLRIHHESK